MIDFNSHLLVQPYEVETEYDELSLSDFIEKINGLIISISNITTDVSDINIIKEELKESYNDFIIPNNFSNVGNCKIYMHSNRKYITEKINLLFTLLQTIENETIEDGIEKLKSLKGQLSYSIKSIVKSFSSICSFDDALKIVTNSYEPYNLFITNVKELAERYITLNPEKLESKIVEQYLAATYNIIYRFSYNIIQCKLFWNKFFELFSTNTFVDIEETDDEIVDYSGVDEYDEDDDDEYSLEEALSNGPANVNGIKKKGLSIFKLLGSLPNKVSKINKKFKLFRTQSKNHFFYKKYMGRIDGLYERYASEAKIQENKMIDDPVKILKEDAKDYINSVSRDFSEVHSNLLDMSKKIQSMTNPKEAMVYIQKYLGIYGKEIKKSNNIPKQMVRATKFKAGEVILKGNKIYGHNIDSIVDKTLPPANHAIVSLFVENSHEKPEMQSVSDVIKDIGSFKLIAKNEKEPIFEMTQICNDIISKGVQKSDISSISTFRKNSRKKIKMNLNEVTQGSAHKSKEKKDLERQMKYIWHGIEDALHYTVKMKKYITELIDAYFTMMIRIDNLCKECIVSLLEIERLKKDERHNPGFKGTSLKAHQNYKQGLDETKTKGEKEAEKMDKNYESSERKADMINKMNELRKSMRGNW